MRQTLLCLISLSLWWPSTLMAHPKAEVVLAAIDIRLTPETVVDAGITVSMAEAHALDPSASPYLRARAVSALAALGNEAARHIIEVVAQIDTHRLVRAQAYTSLARVFGPWDRATVDAFLIRALAAEEDAVTQRIRTELRRLTQGPR